MVVGEDVCLRRLARGNRAREVQFNRFLGNAKVTIERVIESWSEATAAADAIYWRSRTPVRSTSQPR
jgi:hypothetical protein